MDELGASELASVLSGEDVLPGFQLAMADLIPVPVPDSAR